METQLHLQRRNKDTPAGLGLVEKAETILTNTGPRQSQAVGSGKETRLETRACYSWSNKGALCFGAYHTIVIVRIELQNSIGNYSGPISWGLDGSSSSWKI